MSSQTNPLCTCRRPTHESPFVPAYPLGPARAAWECPRLPLLEAIVVRDSDRRRQLPRYLHSGTIFLQLAYLVDKCRTRISARDARISGCETRKTGAPRPMKMSTIRSLCPYDVSARDALQSEKLRHLTTLHHALRALPSIWEDGPLASRSIPGRTDLRPYQASHWSLNTACKSPFTASRVAIAAASL